MIIKLLIPFFIFLTIYLKRNFIFKNYHYEEKHAIHDQKILRFGGLIIFIVSLFFTFIVSNNELLSLFIIFFPIFIVSIIEDIFHNISAKLRFFSILSSSILFLLYFGRIMNVDIEFLSNPFFLSFLTIISIMALTNSFNFIDGVNGLCSICAMSILFSLYIFSDNTLINDFFIIFIPILIIFFLFNYPFQLFFLGDTGAYMLGFFIASLTIITFNTNPALLSWNALLLLIYPCTEMVFTFFRRILFNINPFIADSFHLHTLIYKFLKFRYKTSLLCNNLVVIILLPLVFFGPIACLYINNFLMTMLAIFIFVTLYTLYYLTFKLTLIKLEFK